MGEAESKEAGAFAGVEPDRSYAGPSSGPPRPHFGSYSDLHQPCFWHSSSAIWQGNAYEEERRLRAEREERRAAAAASGSAASGGTTSSASGGQDPGGGLASLKVEVAEWPRSCADDL